MMNLENQLLEAVFEAISNEVHILEPLRDKNNLITDFRYLMGSKSAYGNRGDLTGKTVLTTYPWKRDIGLFDRFVKVTETSEPFSLLVRRDHDRWYNIQAKKFSTGLIVFREDVTVAKQTEEKVMQLNRALFSKNKELQTVSSELKTFNTIAANDYNDTLKHLYNSMEFLISNDAKNLSDAGKANIRRAQAAIQKMKLLTDDIIAFSNIHSEEQMGPVDLNDVLATVLNNLGEKIRTQNATVVKDKLPEVIGYQPLICLLFFHLITNALKFRKPDIDPIIELRYVLEQGTKVQHSSALKDTGYHTISVIDNGIGFDPAESEKIFTMFYRMKEKGKRKGSGVGLAICKKIMDLHGGFIASECMPECTTFNCYFPVQRA